MKPARDDARQGFDVDRVHLAAKLATFPERYQPRTGAELIRRDVMAGAAGQLTE